MIIYKDISFSNNIFFKNYFFKLILIIVFIFVLVLILNNIILYENKNYIDINKNKNNDIEDKTINKNILNRSFEKCYLSSDESNNKIIHFIITRFMIDFYKPRDFQKIIYQKDYILNGIRVMKKYLIPSLENQLCKQFIWILMLGDKADISFVKSLFNFKISFQYKIIYKKDIKNYIRNITKGFNVLITSRIDYDDRIYYDAINDVRKAININRPIFIYGYNRGVHYYEYDNTYYEFNISYYNEGAMSIFVSLIIIINKVNDTYIVYDLGHHRLIRNTLLHSYKSLGIKSLHYEPAFFDNGEVKFVWVRQNYSGQYPFSQFIKKNLKPFNFNLSKFYGK